MKKVALVLIFTLAFTLWHLNSLFAQRENPAREFLDGNFKIFNTLNHPKAKGVHFTIKYPSSWVAYEGERPNIVQKFVSEGGKGFEMSIISTISIPVPNDTKFTEEDLKDLFTPDEMKNMIPAGAKFIKATQTKIEGLTSGILEYSLRMERVGMTIDVQYVAYVFIWNSTMVQLLCSVNKLATSEVNLSHRMEEFKPLFFLMANSIVIPDKWR